MPRRQFFRLALFLGMLIGFISTVHAQAPVCKGMEQATCADTDGCYWVDAYKRRDGVEVSGHCRGKPGSKKSAAEDKTEQTETSGDADSEGEATAVDTGEESE